MRKLQYWIDKSKKSTNNSKTISTQVWLKIGIRKGR